MGQPGGKGHVLSNTAPRPGAPSPLPTKGRGRKFLEKKQHAVFVFIIQRCPNSGSWEAEEPRQGQGHQLSAKLVWPLFFPLVYGNDRMQRSLHAMPMADGHPFSGSISQ